MPIGENTQQSFCQSCLPGIPYRISDSNFHNPSSFSPEIIKNRSLTNQQNLTSKLKYFLYCQKVQLVFRIQLKLPTNWLNIIMLMIQNAYIFTHLITTKWYHYTIVLQIILTTLLAFLVFQRYDKAYFLEIILVCMMTFDILIRYFGNGQVNYWSSRWNKADVSILAVFLLLFVIETLFESAVQIQEVEILIIALRVLSQAYRMLRLIKQQKDSRLVQSLQPVDLSFDNQILVDKFH